MVAFNEPQLQRLGGIPLEASVLRRVVVAAYVDTIDEIGPSMLYGGRYNAKGEFGALYLTVSVDCGVAERIKQVFGNRAALPPLVAATFNVYLKKHLDLTNPDVLGPLGLSVETLTKQN